MQRYLQAEDSPREAGNYNHHNTIEMSLMPPPPSYIQSPVIEYKREEGALDSFQWYCDDCNSLLHEVSLQLEDIVAQLPPLFKSYWDDIESRTCTRCGAVQEPPD